MLILFLKPLALGQAPSMDAGIHRPWKAAVEGVENVNSVYFPSLVTGSPAIPAGMTVLGGFYFMFVILAWMTGSIVHGRQLLRV